MTESGKCPHEHIVTHNSEKGFDFYAECMDCGLTGPEKASPHQARVKFPMAKGARPKTRKEATQQTSKARGQLLLLGCELDPKGAEYA